MSIFDHDTAGLTEVPTGRVGGGLLLAVVSATTFGVSGALASPMLDAGWSAGALVLVRIGLGALVVLPVGLVGLRGRWHLLRRSAGLVTAYGVLAVAGAQFCYFSAVSHMQVGPALLIEYTAPAAVVVWMWLRHGQRPGPVTLLGGGLAAVGLVLVLDLVSGADVNLAGVAWALGAMVGAATYFVISADESLGVPPITLAAGGLVLATVLLGVLGLVGVLPMRGDGSDVVYAGTAVPWWWPLLGLGVVTAAVAYTTGIAAGRVLGSRVASFVALLEVVAGVLFAWLLLDELPRLVQLAGGLLVLLGAVGVRLGEGSVRTRGATARPAAGSRPRG